MVLTKSDYANCIQILKEELLPAMGCTEPIAIAYAAAVARDTLGEKPDKVKVDASGNIIKNVKSVVVPNTGHMRGIPAAVAAGIVAGKAEKKLEVISEVSPEQVEGIRRFLEGAEMDINLFDSSLIFDIQITVFKGDRSARVRIVNNHTNIVLIQKDDTRDTWCN